MKKLGALIGDIVILQMVVAAVIVERLVGEEREQ